MNRLIRSILIIGISAFALTEAGSFPNHYTSRMLMANPLPDGVAPLIPPPTDLQKLQQDVGNDYGWQLAADQWGKRDKEFKHCNVAEFFIYHFDDNGAFDEAYFIQYHRKTEEIQVYSGIPLNSHLCQKAEFESEHSIQDIIEQGQFGWTVDDGAKEHKICAQTDGYGIEVKFLNPGLAINRKELHAILDELVENPGQDSEVGSPTFNGANPPVQSKPQPPGHHIPATAFKSDREIFAQNHGDDLGWDAAQKVWANQVHRDVEEWPFLQVLISYFDEGGDLANRFLLIIQKSTHPMEARVYTVPCPSIRLENPG